MNVHSSSFICNSENLVTNHKEKEQTDWAELYHGTLIFNEKELKTGNLTSTILQNG